MVKKEPYKIIEDAINKIYREYNVAIKSCNFEWIDDHSTYGSKGSVLHTMEINGVLFIARIP